MNKIKLAAIIVTYNPDIDILIKNVTSISSQVEATVIVDNGSDNYIDISHAIDKYNNVVALRNSTNKGIAQALNYGMTYLHKSGYNWVLTLDQDSICEPNMATQLSSHIDENIGILCPSINYLGWSGKSKKDRPIIEEIKACMTSASLTNVKAWESCGKFNEGYFIDFVDNDFCERLRINKYKIIRINSCILNHKLGEAFEKKIIGKFSIRYSIHNPIRYYYMTRNNIVFIRTYRERLNILREYLKLLYIITIGLIFSTEKRETCKYVRLGITHANKGIMGKLSNY